MQTPLDAVTKTASCWRHHFTSSLKSSQFIAVTMTEVVLLEGESLHITVQLEHSPHMWRCGPAQQLEHSLHMLCGPAQQLEHSPHMLCGPAQQLEHSPHMLCGPAQQLEHSPHMLCGPAQQLKHSPHMWAGTTAAHLMWHAV